MKTHYSEEDANAILSRAIERQTMGGEMSREQLTAIAAELGIAPEALAKAEEDWHLDREDTEERTEFQRYLRDGFKSHLFAYIGVNAFLFLMNMATDRDPWFLFPL